jgi:F-type H+-transporting ATPase subunit gamma
MANQRQIKRRIGAANNISKITKAMEMVAASKMKKAQEQAIAARDYSLNLYQSLQKITAKVDPKINPLLQVPESGLDILVVIGTNKGLCGSLNAQLWKETEAWIKDHPQGKIVAVGKKVAHFCKVSGYEIYAEFSELPENVTTRDTVVISELAKQKFLEDEFKSVSVLYMDFINTLSQKPNMIQVLPLQSDLDEQVRDDVGPGQSDQEDEKVAEDEYEFEPSAEEILNNLLPFYIENTIYQAFLEARASEHSSRMVTMKSASENANQLVDDLRLLFNKSRQASITTELLDITTATLTLES